ncbi:MAG TPA: photosystem reaction center subunit H [Candidatus Methanoperedenaceae archaeon]|nr:photosystem reaction center subunit H [Candidatus Methanoperedenaceae archaeon]
MRTEISSLFGLNLYTEKGIYVGRVDDVVLETADKKIVGLAVGKLNPELFDNASRGVVIPYRWVTAVADIVLMRQVANQFKKTQTKEEGYTKVGGEEEEE